MAAVDRRLFAWGRPTRAFLTISVLLGIARAFLLVTQAWLLATIISGAFLSHQDLGALSRPMTALLVVVGARAVVAWSQEASAHRCSALVKSQLRTAMVKRIAVLGPDGVAVGRTGDLATLTVRGIDALDGYFSRYVPDLVLSVAVPVAVLIAVGLADWVSLAIMVVTLPLIPVFMALIGLTTRSSTDRQLRTLQRLSGHFLDVVSGLTTLKTFGRSKAQSKVIGEVTESYRRRLIGTLRVTFLSSLVLELLASVSVALIAVAIGLRLLDGHLDLRPALFVLVLAPEAYLPLRQLAADYHASSEGVSAATQVFDLLDQPVPAHGMRTDVPDPLANDLNVEGVTVRYPGRDHPTLDALSYSARPGEVLALTGPSGCGKSTALAVLLGLVQVDAGQIRIGDVDLASLDPEVRRQCFAWVPQHPHLFAATIGENIRIGRAEADEIAIRRAVAAAGLADVVARLPNGLDTVLGERGAGLSAGERQRVALARAFVRDAPVLLLDEPTANLDGQTEAEVLEAIRRVARGRTVVLVAHRPALLALADRVVDLALSGVAA